MTINLELPEDIERQLNAEWPDLSRKALEALAVEGYRHEVLSRGQVGEVLALDRWATEAFLQEHRVHRQYDVSDLDEDLAITRQIVNAGE